MNKILIVAKIKQKYETKHCSSVSQPLDQTLAPQFPCFLTLCTFHTHLRKNSQCLSRIELQEYETDEMGFTLKAF